MTEFEMAYLLNEMRMSVTTYATISFTTVSGFLVAGYLAAHQLNRSMLTTVIFLYTIWFWGNVSNLSTVIIDIGGLVDEMHVFEIGRAHV